MTHVELIQIAVVPLDRGKYSWIWVVLRCPYCGKPHKHYGGPLETNPGGVLGNA